MTTEFADYAAPPVIEVAYGVQFTPLKNWKIPHFGAFWQLVREEFPQCEHAPVIGDLSIIDENSGLPLPRVWLVNDSDDRLIQLQLGRFLSNWRYREGSGPYPRYHILSEEFFGHFETFRRFLDESDLGELEVKNFDLTYFNHIYGRDGWQLPEAFGEVMKPVIWLDESHEFLPRPRILNWQAEFAFAEQPGRLTVKLNPAKRNQDGEPLLLLEMSAQGRPETDAIGNMKDWFAAAHEWIVRGFADLTTERAQKELWRKHE